MYRYVYYTELGFRNFGHTWVLLWRIELQTLLSHQVVELQTGLAELSEKASGDKCRMDDEGLVGVTLVFGLPEKWHQHRFDVPSSLPSRQPTWFSLLEHARTRVLWSWLQQLSKVIHHQHLSGCWWSQSTNVFSMGWWATNQLSSRWNRTAQR